MRMSERLEQIKTNWNNYHMSIPDVKWLIEQAERVQEFEQVIGDLYEDIKELELLRIKEKRKTQRYKQALEYIQRAIYTQHCTKNHKWNTEFEKGQISGLIQASNIVDKAIRKVEGETE
jgi:hypothetical protein